jgi:hypothetical protein
MVSLRHVGDTGIEPFNGTPVVDHLSLRKDRSGRPRD